MLGAGVLHPPTIVPETWNLNKHCLDLIQEIEMYSMVGVLNTTITQFTNYPVK